MKKHFITLTTILILLTTVHLNAVLAQTNEATDSADIDEKINLIKEKVASKVAEIAEEISVGLTGEVTEVKESLLTITANGMEKTVQAEDAKILIRNSRLQTAKGSLSEIEEDDLATVIGTEQFGTDIIKADLIVSTPQIVFFAGKITGVDENKFTFTIKEGGEEYTFDYETYTNASKLENDEFSQIGFSALKKDTFVQILATSQKSSPNTFTAHRLLSI